MMADNMATVSRIPGGANCKGPMFEIKTIATLYLRGLKSERPFQLASNVKGAGALDDIVFKCKMAERWCTLFVQLKHKEAETPVLKFSDFSASTGAFSLVRYFESYIEITLAKKADDGKGAHLFDGALEDTTCVIFTNAVPNDFLKNGRCVDDLQMLQTFLLFGVGTVLRFDPNRDTNLVEILKNRWNELSGLEKYREAIAQLDCDKEIESFMERFRIFCAQPSESELHSFVEKELGYLKENFSIANKLGRLAECLIDNVKTWSESTKCEILNEDSEILLRARGKVIVETLTSVEESTYRLDVTFEPSILSEWKEKIEQLRLVSVESSERSFRLSCTKIFQAIGNSYFVFSRTSLEKNLDAVISECKHGDHKTVIIIWNPEMDGTSDDKVKTVCDILKESKKHVVVLSYTADTNIPFYLGNLSSWHPIRDLFEFPQIDEISRDKILETKFLFQGLEVSLNQYLDGCCDKGTDLLSATSVVEILESGSNMSVGPILTSTVEHYIPRVLVSMSMLKYSIFQGCSETITIVNSTIGDVIRSVTMQSSILSMNHQDIKKIIDDKILILSAAESRLSEEKIFLGAQFVIGSYECNFLHFRKKAIALRIRPQSDNPDKRFLVGWYVFVLKEITNEDITYLYKFQGSKHLLKFEDKDLIWLKSEGNIDTIRNHIDENKVAKVDLSIDSDSDDRLSLICAEPGMGKTTLVSENAVHTKKELPHFWVSVLSLNDHTTLFSNNVHANVLDFLATAIGIKSNLQKSFLKFALEVSGNVVVILDGFDEISYRYFKQCIVLISNLLKTKAKQVFVTSRNTMKTKLEDEFKRFAIQIRKLNDDEQRSYLKLSWENISILNADESEDFVTRLLEKASKDMSDREKSFLGTPLQLFMMAEVFKGRENVLGNTSALPAKLDLLHLMKAFVDKKIDIFVHEKRKTKRTANNEDSEIKDQTKKLVKTHGIVSLLSIIDEEMLGKLHNKKIRRKALKLLAEIESCEYNTGIIDRVVNQKPRFIHRIIAEYFAAKWFSKNFDKNKDFLEDNLYDASFSGIRMFFDRLLSESRVLHTAVLNEDLVKVRKMAEDDDQLNSKDKGERTALHLASSFLPTKDKLETARTCKILDLLINRNPDFNLVDNVLNRSPLQYADIAQSWTAINMLLPYYPPDPKVFLTKTLKSLENNEMHDHIVIYDLDKLLTICRDEGLTVDFNTLDNRGMSKLLQMLQNGSHRVFAAMYSTENSHPGLFQLHHVASLGDIDAVQRLILNAFPDDDDGTRIREFVNAKDANGLTALYYAALHGHIALLPILIDHGADIECDFNGLLTPLYIAAVMGHEEVIRILLDAVPGRATTAIESHAMLVCASMCGHTRVITQLLGYLDEDKKAAVIKVADISGTTPIIAACFWGYLDIVKELINAVDDIEKAEYVTMFSPSGYNALFAASTQGHLEIVRLILDTLVETERSNYVKNMLCQENTALIGAAQGGHTEVVNILLNSIEIAERAGFIMKRGKLEVTSLTAAAIGGNREILKVLLDNLKHLERSLFLDFIMALSTTGLNVLMMAASYGHTQFVNYLLDVFNYNDRVTIVTACNNDGQTSLYAAATGGQVEVMKVLLSTLSTGIDTFGKSVRSNFVMCSNKNGLTPLIIAATAGYSEFVKCLLDSVGIAERQEVITQTDNYGRNALHAAANFGHNEVMIVLLNALRRYGDAECSNFVQAKNGKGVTALMNAAAKGHTDFVRGLLEAVNLAEKAAFITVQENGGMTALHAAATGGHKDVIHVLLEPLRELGGSVVSDFVRIQSANGSSALTFAATGGHTEFVRDLISVVNVADRAVVVMDKNMLSGMTALHSAASGGHTKVMEVLLEVLSEMGGSLCADFVRVKAYNGITAQLIAQTGGHAEFVREMLEAEDVAERRRLELAVMATIIGQTGAALLED